MRSEWDNVNLNLDTGTPEGLKLENVKNEITPIIDILEDNKSNLTSAHLEEVYTRLVALEVGLEV